jgi:cell division protein FtsL|tara:strand:+ start:514 stop:711 length:198 start_codon:yes stop_codon:yes gene_type:complete
VSIKKLLTLIFAVVSVFLIMRYLQTDGQYAQLSKLSQRLKEAQQAFEDELSDSIEDLTSDYDSRK